MRSIEKNELNKKHTIQMIDLEKLKRVKRNAFQKIIKNHKRKNGKKTLNDKIDFDRFSSFYSKLILNDTHYSDEHKRIKLVVENKCDELKDQIFEEAFEYSDVERAMKRLKNGKSTGFDFISSEMLINCKNEKMLLNFQIIFNCIFKNGLKLKNMNISTITPIPKKNESNGDPDNYRPISVSNTYCLLYENLLLEKIENVFQFSKNQFGYRRATSCKHSSFVINETRHYMVKGRSPCYIVNLDMKKAFDKLWRHCLFYKLLNQIDNSYWRAIINYYENSS